MLTDRRRRVVLVPVEEDGTTKACVRSNTKVLLLGSPRIEEDDNMRNVKASQSLPLAFIAFSDLFAYLNDN